MIKEYEKNGYLIQEYKNGTKIKSLISAKKPQEVLPVPSDAEIQEALFKLELMDAIEKIKRSVEK